MLADLQNSVSTILRDNNDLKEEVAQIRMSFQSQGRDIEDLKKKLVKVTNGNQSLRNEHDQTRKRLKDQEEDFLRLWADMDELEQYSRKRSLEFHGIPESAYSSTEAAVFKLAEALNIALFPTNIDISH